MRLLVSDTQYFFHGLAFFSEKPWSFTRRYIFVIQTKSNEARCKVEIHHLRFTTGKNYPLLVVYFFWRFFIFAPPCLTLNRGFDLQITKILPRRLTTWQSLWRFFIFPMELTTFMPMTMKGSMAWSVARWRSFPISVVAGGDWTLVTGIITSCRERRSKNPKGRGCCERTATEWSCVDDALPVGAGANAAAKPTRVAIIAHFIVVTMVVVGTFYAL
mmetsp:Transcript_10602/g.22353  ORF Transcript_10602/g.22353 Transcript_10602/m.22353 type:complete len:216 (+) Transcript_10602:130-777(+)